jgi:hypothetical protein
MKGKKLTVEDLREMDGKQVYVHTAYLVLGGEGIYTVDIKNHRLYRKEINNYEASLNFDSIKNEYSYSLGCNIFIYELIEDKQEDIIDDSEIKVGDYVYYIYDGVNLEKSYSICRVEEVKINNFSSKIVEGFWSCSVVKSLPKTLNEFNLIEKKCLLGWMEVDRVKKLNLTDDTQLKETFRNESKSGIKSNSDLPKQFTKSDLKTGMCVEFRNGSGGLIFLNDGTIIGSVMYFPIELLNEDLICEKDRGYDVIKIYNCNLELKHPNYKLIWQSEETPINYRSNKYSGSQYFNNELVTVNQEENKTTVTLNDNTKAEVFCDENTKFDPNKGLEIAYWKAKELQAKNMREKVKGE